MTSVHLSTTTGTEWAGNGSLLCPWLCYVSHLIHPCGAWHIFCLKEVSRKKEKEKGLYLNLFVPSTSTVRRYAIFGGPG